MIAQMNRGTGAEMVVLLLLLMGLMIADIFFL
jgi:hypothetical protein